MIYNFVRLLLFFDLPMTTKKEKRTYTHFRKYLIKNGYLMVQYSVYCRIFPNRESAINHINILRKNIPKDGQIRIMVVTEKQYSKMEIIVGGKSKQEEIVTSESFIKL
ncbi:MAG: CRISPR-associated endonuclease Cas2 [Bacilli bacterium]|nr:CRISPR-associated endonuclease Cas2 [Bacilli bacterium]